MLYFQPDIISLTMMPHVMLGLVIRVYVLTMLCYQYHCLTRLTLLVPPSVDACIKESERHPIDPLNAKIDCLQRLLWYYQPNQNGTLEDAAYFSSLSERTMRRKAPETGFRTRKAYRALTDADRDKLHSAFNRLYQSGALKRYAELHSRAVKKIYGGPAFLPWSRIFLAHFEEELRKVSSRSVSLPYIDSSADYEMDNPVNSVLWSSKLLGNANGRIVTGPFKNWRTAAGYLQRNYAAGARGRLISKDDIRKIMNKCKTSEIVYPLATPHKTKERKHVLEYHHQGVLDWIGGDAANPIMAAYDPVFYMSLAFIDYLWELVRRRQVHSCRTDPEWDYPVKVSKKGHGASDMIEGFDKYRNIDGLSKFWTTSWYNYEDHAKCPDCGASKYLYCNTTSYRCYSHSRRSDYNVGGFRESPRAKGFGILSERFEPEQDYMPKFLPSNYKAEGPLNNGHFVFTALRDAKNAIKSYRRSGSNFTSTVKRVYWKING